MGGNRKNTGAATSIAKNTRRPFVVDLVVHVEAKGGEDEDESGEASAHDANAVGGHHHPGRVGQEASSSFWVLSRASLFARAKTSFHSRCATAFTSEATCLVRSLHGDGTAREGGRRPKSITTASRSRESRSTCSGCNVNRTPISSSLSSAS